MDMYAVQTPNLTPLNNRITTTSTVDENGNPIPLMRTMVSAYGTPNPDIYWDNSIGDGTGSFSVSTSFIDGAITDVSLIPPTTSGENV